MLTNLPSRYLWMKEGLDLKMVDELLIGKTLAGSLECFDALMHGYQRDIFAVARGYTKSGSPSECTSRTQPDGLAPPVVVPWM